MSEKKKVVILNSVPYGSTGTIAKGIQKILSASGDDTLVYFSWTKGLKKSSDPQIMVGSFLDKFFHLVLGQLTGFHGCLSVVDTWMLVKKLKQYKPDVVNLHILHSWGFNLPILFRYLNRENIRVIWTMHDCWAFTGQCVHYTLAKCERWKNGCGNCIQKKKYPKSCFDRSKLLWNMKRELFLSCENLEIVVPSHWMKEQIKSSFLAEKKVTVIPNGIDLSVFRPRVNQVKGKYHCEGKILLLGVAFEWGERKGLDVLIKMSQMLDPSRYQIILVGTDDVIDQQLPDSIISIHRTESKIEMAELYSAADLFLNPTREDTFPTVNIEAMACGTPVLTFRTGGSPEIIEEGCGTVVECNDIGAFYRSIVEQGEKTSLISERCVSVASKYEMSDRFREYFEVIHNE